MNTRVVLVAIGLAGSIVFGASVNDSAAPSATDMGMSNPLLPAPPSAAPTHGAIASLPTVAPAHMTAVAEPTPRAGFAATTTLPRLERRQRTASSPPFTPTTESRPANCDPAYPESRTCIPPGPPFGQGCAITPERLFTVLPPDPQALDHDHDGIGCEPIAN